MSRKVGRRAKDAGPFARGHPDTVWYVGIVRVSRPCVSKRLFFSSTVGSNHAHKSFGRALMARMHVRAQAEKSKASNACRHGGL